MFVIFVIYINEVNQYQDGDLNYVYLYSRVRFDFNFKIEVQRIKKCIFLILFLKYVIIVFIIYLRLILFFRENCVLLIIFGSLVIMVMIKIFIKYCKGK